MFYQLVLTVNCVHDDSVNNKSVARGEMAKQFSVTRKHIEYDEY